MLYKLMRPAAWLQVERKHTLKGHADAVTSLCFSPDSFLLASGSDDNTVRMWDVQSGNLRTIFTGHNAKVHALNFIGSGTILFSVSKDRCGYFRNRLP